MSAILLKALGFILLCLIYAALQRRFFPETLANGFMNREKGKEIAPTVFGKKNDSKKSKHSDL